MSLAPTSAVAGCWSQGATEEEALANLQVAICEYVEAAEELAIAPA